MRRALLYSALLTMSACTPLDLTTQRDGDVGNDDSGFTHDAGVSDAGQNDAGAPDAAISAFDAGALDSGIDDAGVSDSGTSDSGASDSGVSDAGMYDAGATDSGMADAGLADAGTPDAGGNDSGTIDAGTPDANVTLDGSVSFLGDGGVFKMTSAPMPLPTTSALSIWGDTAGNIYVAGYALGWASIMHAHRSTVLDAGFSVVHSEPGGDFSELRVTPSGNVYVIGTTQAWGCNANCATGGGYSVVATSTIPESFNGLCLDGEKVYFVSHGGGLTGTLHVPNGSTWTPHTFNLTPSVFSVAGCAVDPTDHSVVIASRAEVIRWNGTSFTNEATPDQQWRLVLPSGSRLILGGEGAIGSNRDGGWAVEVEYDSRISSLRAGFSHHPAEVFLLGSSNWQYNLFVLRPPNDWEGSTYSGFDISGAWAFSDNEFYLCGDARPGGEGVVHVGRR